MAALDKPVDQQPDADPNHDANHPGQQGTVDDVTGQCAHRRSQARPQDTGQARKRKKPSDREPGGPGGHIDCNPAGGDEPAGQHQGAPAPGEGASSELQGCLTCGPAQHRDAVQRDFGADQVCQAIAKDRARGSSQCHDHDKGGRRIVGERQHRGCGDQRVAGHDQKLPHRHNSTPTTTTSHGEAPSATMAASTSVKSSASTRVPFGRCPGQSSRRQP